MHSQVVDTWKIKAVHMSDSEEFRDSQHVLKGILLEGENLKVQLSSNEGSMKRTMKGSVTESSEEASKSQVIKCFTIIHRNLTREIRHRWALFFFSLWRSKIESQIRSSKHLIYANQRFKKIVGFCKISNLTKETKTEYFRSRDKIRSLINLVLQKHNNSAAYSFGRWRKGSRKKEYISAIFSKLSFSILNRATARNFDAFQRIHRATKAINSRCAQNQIISILKSWSNYAKESTFLRSLIRSTQKRNVFKVFLKYWKLWTVFLSNSQNILVHVKAMTEKLRNRMLQICFVVWDRKASLAINRKRILHQGFALKADSVKQCVFVLWSQLFYTESKGSKDQYMKKCLRILFQAWICSVQSSSFERLMHAKQFNVHQRLFLLLLFTGNKRLQLTIIMQWTAQVQRKRDLNNISQYLTRSDLFLRTTEAFLIWKESCKRELLMTTVSSQNCLMEAFRAMLTSLRRKCTDPKILAQVATICFTKACSNDLSCEISLKGVALCSQEESNQQYQDNVHKVDNRTGGSDSSNYRMLEKRNRWFVQELREWLVHLANLEMSLDRNAGQFRNYIRVCFAEFKTAHATAMQKLFNKQDQVCDNMARKFRTVSSEIQDLREENESLRIQLMNTIPVVLFEHAIVKVAEFRENTIEANRKLLNVNQHLTKVIEENSILMQILEVMALLIA